jgi:UDPglucose 6-dehydrogenase
MRVSVLGAGYVGLTTAVCLSHLGHSVTVYESDPVRSATLQEGRVPFHETRLPELLRNGLATGNVCVAETAEKALRGADLVLICVGTPLDRDGHSDLRQVQSACGMVAEHANQAAVVIRSTLPLGETVRAGTWLERDNLDGVVTNPEFLRQGTAVGDFLDPTRIVVGTQDGSRTSAAERLLDLYAGLSAPIIVTDFNSAEMIKNASNAFLAAKLSFVNEVADLCEAYGADVTAVIPGVGLDPRIGSTYLNPGIGFGGSCLPKELANMVRLGQQRGLAMPLMTGAAQTNDQRAARIADRIETLIGGVREKRVAMLGLAFKPGTDDLRYSPAIAIVRELTGRGASVVGHDPVVPPSATATLASFQQVDAVESALDASELVILATEWPEYSELNWRMLRSRVRRPVIFDGRNVLDVTALHDAGWSVIRVGRATE